MSAIKDGGPAFPFVEPNTACAVALGMSLRDYFAAKAMQAEMITTFSDATPKSASDFANAAAAAGRDPAEHLAHNAYEIADAMLAAREAQR